MALIWQCECIQMNYWWNTENKKVDSTLLFNSSIGLFPRDKCQMSKSSINHHSLDNVELLQLMMNTKYKNGYPTAVVSNVFVVGIVSEL